jgi:hypothetical protein
LQQRARRLKKSQLFTGIVPVREDEPFIPKAGIIDNTTHMRML